MNTIHLVLLIAVQIGNASNGETAGIPEHSTEKVTNTNQVNKPNPIPEQLPSDSPPPSSWDRQQKRTTPAPENEGVTMGMQALKTLFGLGIVLALLFLSSRIVSRKLGSVRWKSKDGRLQVADFMLLDGKNGIYIVEIDGHDWIVVTGPNGTSMAPKLGEKKTFQLGHESTGLSKEALDLKSGSLLESAQGETQ